MAGRASTKHRKFKAEYLQPIVQIKPQQKKSPSLASNHTLDDLEQPPPKHVAPIAGDPVHDDRPSAPDRVETDPFEDENQYLYAETRRKRKSGPSAHSGASTSRKLRKKHQVVVSYDGFVQEHLDALVEQLGSGQNNLRKGNNALVAAKGFRFPRPSRAGVQNYGSIEDIPSILTSRSNPALSVGKKASNAPQSDTSDHESTFFQVDKGLESIQSLCEIAAHRFLRDGGCQTEMNTIKQKLAELLTRATAFAGTLRILGDEQPQDSRPEADDHFLILDNSRRGCDGTLSIDTPSLAHPNLMPRRPVAINQAGDHMKARGTFLGPLGIPVWSDALVANNIIEPEDESEQEDIVVDMTAFRWGNRSQARV